MFLKFGNKYISENYIKHRNRPNIKVYCFIELLKAEANMEIVSELHSRSDKIKYYASVGSHKKHNNIFFKLSNIKKFSTIKRSGRKKQPMKIPCDVS